MNIKDEIKTFIGKKPFVYYRVDEGNMEKFIYHAIDNNKLSFNINFEISEKIVSNSFIFIDANDKGTFL